MQSHAAFRRCPVGEQGHVVVEHRVERVERGSALDDARGRACDRLAYGLRFVHGRQPGRRSESAVCKDVAEFESRRDRPLSRVSASSPPPPPMIFLLVIAIMQFNLSRSLRDLVFGQTTHNL